MPPTISSRLIKGLQRARFLRRCFSTDQRGLNGTVGRRAKYLAVAGASGATATGFLWLQYNDRSTHPHLEVKCVDSPLSGRGLTAEGVTRMLSNGAYSYLARQASGVRHYDGAQVASNAPCEDRYIHGSMASPWDGSPDWMAWGVFDGHSGWQTAGFLAEHLVPFVRRSIGNVTLAAGTEAATADDVASAIKSAFVAVDNIIIKNALHAGQSDSSLQDKIAGLATAFAGSCALLALFDPSTRQLRVACTGDSRAVLGRLTAEGKWEAVPLSTDQNGRNQDEIDRIMKEHPGETTIAEDGRILGLAVSRAFGDARWKIPIAMQEEYQRRFHGPSVLTPRYDIRTPPYLTAEPVVTTTTIDQDKSTFLILASDGMWDSLSDQQAVDLVGQWLQTSNRGKVQQKTYPSFDFGHFWTGTPWRFTEERTTVQDENAAVHLARNALGGNHAELIGGRLTVAPPLCRRVRDDATIQVVFFRD